MIRTIAGVLLSFMATTVVAESRSSTVRRLPPLVATNAGGIVADGSVLTAESCLPSNGAIDPFETVTVEFTLRNVGATDTTDIVASLSESGGVTFPSAPQSYGALLAGGGSVARPFTFIVSSSCASSVTATFDISDGGNPLGTVTFTLIVGANVPIAQSFSNPTPIGIGTSPSGPYPSSINVSGWSGPISDIRVTLHGLNHTYESEIDILLVGPLGQNMILMSDVGGGYSAVNNTITFTDFAPILPNAEIVDGVWAPADYAGGIFEDYFGPPAPEGPWPSPGPNGSATLMGTFASSDPNGTWNLYVVNDYIVGSGNMSGGWSIEFLKERRVCCASLPTFDLSSAEYSVGEGDASVDVIINRTGPATGPVTVTLATADGEATGDVDYSTILTSVLFAEGEMTKIVAIPIAADPVHESNESFTVSLSDPAGGAVLGTTTAATVVIVDNDPLPEITEYPSSGTTLGGTSVTILGVFLSGATAVTFDGIPADFIVQSDSEIIATLPVHPTPASVPLVVTTPAGESFPVVFRYEGPEAFGISTTDGPASGGTTVVIYGSYFGPGATVTFGGVPAPSVTVDSPIQLTVVTPSVPPGVLMDVVVTNVDGNSTMVHPQWFSDFLDVPHGSNIHDFVEAIVRAYITGGCGGGNYCPNIPTTRAQMAVFLLIAKHGAGFVPPTATGTVFADVAANSFAASFIEHLYNEGVTGGCATNPPRYCPTSSVTRAQMAVFLIKAHDGTVTPGTPAGIFSDVPTNSPFAWWIETLYNRGITGGCSINPLAYCPNSTVTRGQMAVFLTATWGLPFN